MKCVVTGGSGFIGSHLVDRLLAEGHSVAVLDSRQPIQVENPAASGNVEWLNKDIRVDLGDIFRGYDCIYHLAAMANAIECTKAPDLCIATNILGTTNILAAALKGGVDRVILASTCWVAGAQEGDIITEDSLFRLDQVNTIYGASKIAQEMLCYSFFSEYKAPKYTILRYGIPYGERMRKGLVIRIFMELAEKSGVIKIAGDGKQARDFLYVGDLCEAHILALNPIAENKVYNLPGPNLITIKEVAGEVTKYFAAKIEHTPQNRVEPKLKHIEGELAKTELGWVAKTTFEDGVKKCVEWWNSLTKNQTQ
ncbi:MAG: NAD-dependent epimerase/dehydratase family protein [Candidatus Stahlbacteria bacterium]|nr:NAD-dependent epimerase/dehydratase family protein [Candidatus Stahlbacteria bacterium]